MDELLSRVLDNEWLVFALPSILLLVCAEVGFRLGLRLYETDDEARRQQIGGIQGALLGLLALLLGFTFAMAVNHYDTRRDLVVKEANAIGTTFLRAAMLPDGHRAPVEDLLRRYVDLRITFQPLVGDPAKLAEALRASADLQRQLWDHATAAAKESPTPIVASFVVALNETIDTEAERVAAGRHRVPGAIWLLLLIVASLSCIVSTYFAGAEGKRSAFSALVLPLLIAVVATLIFDLSDPRRGTIRTPQQALIDLQQSIRASDR